MSDKRQDSTGQKLRTGESLRSDQRYQYRYTDISGVRRTVYANSLSALREKEKQIQRDLDDGIDYSAGGISVLELAERYLDLKQGVRYNTKVNYNFVLNILRKELFGQRKIRDIKTSDAKRWMLQMHRNGRRYSTLTTIRGVLRPAFHLACQDDVLRKNPFDFTLTDVVPNDTVRREALTEQEQQVWMEFIRLDPTYSKYYDEFVVLLETGMRVSEFCGLTKSDLDFTHRKIRVDHQLIRERNGTYYVEKTKTEAGRRFIPMTDHVYASLKNILSNRRKLKQEPVINGYTGFLLIDQNGNPKVSLHIENEMRWARKKYEKIHPDFPLPNITPHVLRHTFCTNMANAGMGSKDLQYIMGHSDISTTLNTYTHASYDHAAEQMSRLVDLSPYLPAQQATGSW